MSTIARRRDDGSDLVLGIAVVLSSGAFVALLMALGYLVWQTALRPAGIVD